MGKTKFLYAYIIQANTHNTYMSNDTNSHTKRSKIDCIDWITIFTKDEGEAGGGSRDRPEELDDDAYT